MRPLLLGVLCALGAILASCGRPEPAPPDSATAGSTSGLGSGNE